MPSKVKFLSKEELENMHTGSLMKRRKELLSCEESIELSDISSDLEKQSTIDLIEFKNTIEWEKAYSDVKNILSTRENLPSREERKIKRVERAKNRNHY